MSSSDTTPADLAISARELRKVFRLYTKPQYRFLDMFGLLGHRPGAYTEHSALDGVSIDIRRGEKVAVIGRNGAGKSTFLKLITRVVEPTSGTLAVAGKVHALLQIGTGFHPDFSGRQNVQAYLAQLGVMGREAKSKVAEIIEFAELEEYIDQPVKTYSTGMAVRLMFSTATAITPELLVLDEVLGVGDAYFAQKSYERMRELTSTTGTTLVLVTHDIYSALKICDRLIWIDRGRVLMDGDGASVVKAYEDSIRMQEEERLRTRKLQRMAAVASDSSQSQVLVELHAQKNLPQPSPVYIRRFELVAAGRTYPLPLGSDAFDELRGSHLQREPGSWGPPAVWEGEPSRAMLNYGSPFHKVAGVFVLAHPISDHELGTALVRVSYWSEHPCALVLKAFLGPHPIELGVLPVSEGQWIEHAVALRAADPGAAKGPDTLAVSGVHGTGAISVDDVSLLGAGGKSVHIVTHGEPVSFQIDFRILDPHLNERAQVVVAIHRDGVMGACRFVARELLFDATRQSRGRVRLDLDRMMLGLGNYSVSVVVAAEGYLEREQVHFYSMNREVYAALSHVMEFMVIGEGLAATNTVFVGEGSWTMHSLEQGGEDEAR